jgi:hypothetical protein
MANGLPSPFRFRKVVGDLVAATAKAAKGEGRRVAACGECSPVLWAQGKADAVIRLERLWNEIVKTYDVNTLCGYVSNGFHGQGDRQIYKRICAEHSAVVPSGPATKAVLHTTPPTPPDLP